MGMFSEIATAGTVKAIVQEIKKNLEENRNNLAVCIALKRLGRFALMQFEWDTPTWAQEYEELFNDSGQWSPATDRAEKHWTALMSALGNPKGSGEILKGLLASYGESHRAYHTSDHIVSMLDECGEIEGQLVNPRVVKMAIWYHDVVYEPATKDHRVIADNEERSAYRAELDLKKLKMPKKFIARVGELIRATTHAVPVSDPDVQFLVDLDLAILGRSAREFDTYEAGIRKEYQRILDPDFRAGRAKVLKSFLKRPSIYSTRFFQERYEIVARQNLKIAIRRLLK